MKIVTLIPLIFLLHGCATFEPKEGMTLREVSQNAYVPCDGYMKKDRDHIKFIKNHPQNPDIKIYNTVALAVYNRGKPECQQDLLFYDSKLISIKTASELIDNYNTPSHAQQGDLFRKSGDAVDSVVKKIESASTDIDESIKNVSTEQKNNSINNQLNKNASITSQEIDIRGFKIGMSINEVLNNIKKTVPKNNGLEYCRILNLGAIDFPELYLRGDQYILCEKFEFFNKLSIKFELFFIDSKLVLLEMPLNNFDIEGDWTKNLMVPDYYIALNEKFAVSPPFLQSGGKKDRFNSNWEYRSLFSDTNGSTVRIDGNCRGVISRAQCRDNVIKLFTVDYGKILETRQVKLNVLTKLYNDKIKENDKSKL